MAVTVSESYNSRPATVGLTAQRELIYDCFSSHTDTDQDVIDAVNAAVPEIYQGLVIESIQVEPLTDVLWKAHILYKRREDESEYTFDTSGGQVKITQSYNTVSYGSAYTAIYGDPPDFNGAIGVSEDKVEGVEITIPKYDFSETHLFQDAIVDGSFKKTLRDLTGTLNVAAFKSFDPGEVLFLGASGTRRGDLQWAITFRFSSSKNAVGLTIGSIDGVDKGGWQYLWVRYGDFIDDTAFQLVKRPIAAYVETVYLSSDFGLLMIGG